MFAAIICSVVSASLLPIHYSSPAFFVHGDSPGKNSGVGCHDLLQSVFSIQESNTGSPALQEDSLPVELPGKPRVWNRVSQS